MISKIQKLKEKIEILNEELHYLHYTEVNEDQYKQRRFDIEYEIACIEDLIVYEKSLLPFKVTIFVTCAVFILTILYYIL